MTLVFAKVDRSLSARNTRRLNRRSIQFVSALPRIQMDF
ncbi:hypothetical protein LBWT_X3440 (plasmid) [Leptolyngbya boryana IAM M-101]|nr:hypothetical protein LBWT_X3440 [Leptolyngbya boryana IAM M-101]BAS66620.1 hypothetical protein LBDG_X3440 [Leptolyngbya boryana dg5]